MFEKEFEKLIEVVKDGIALPTHKRIENDDYLILPDGSFEIIHHNQQYPKCREVYGLDMFCQLINREWTTRESFLLDDGDDHANVLYIDVRAHNMVTAYTGYFTNKDLDFMSLVLYQAKECEMPGIPRGYMAYDEARIALNSCLVETPDQEYVLKLLSNIVQGDQAEIKDNGVSQMVKVQTGVQLMGMETIRPIVTLKPYRTFPEIEQPESEFLLRIRDNQVGIFEADGGMWKLEAKRRIKAYLEEQLEDLICAGRVVVGM